MSSPTSKGRFGALPDSKFPLGTTVCTPGAIATLTPEETIEALRRHVRGDWGDCSSEDSAQNDIALVEGDRILSVYASATGVRFWVITESDRSATTVLLPEEY